MRPAITGSGIGRHSNGSCTRPNARSIRHNVSSPNRRLISSTGNSSNRSTFTTSSSLSDRTTLGCNANASIGKRLIHNSSRPSDATNGAHGRSVHCAARAIAQAVPGEPATDTRTR